MRIWLLVLVLLTTLTMGGCELVGDIFQAGIAVGVIVAVLIVVGIALLGRKLMR